MTKRFHSEDNCKGYYTEIIDEEKELDLSLPNPKKNLTIEELVNVLNALYNENEQLKSDVYEWKASAEDYLKLGKSLKKENEQLKQQVNELSKENIHLDARMMDLQTRLMER